MSRRSLTRLGLFQLGAGIVSVLLLGVLNRVMRVEMGMDLLLVSIILGGGHYLGALVAIPVGFYSDRRPIRGRRRTPYILAGVTIVALALVLSPYVARWLAASGGLLALLAGLSFFFIEGIGTFVAGTAFLALLTDLTHENERGRAVAFVWTLLLAGILVGAILAAASLGDYSFAALSQTFAAVAGIVLGLALVAVFRQEPAGQKADPGEAQRSLRDSLSVLTHSRQSRLFFAFLVIGLFSMFAQDVVLEPFGGEVLGLSVRATSLFNAYQIVGTIGAIWIGGSLLVPRLGKNTVTAAGAWIMVVGFGLLAATALLKISWLAPPAIFVIGSGMGFFTVGGVALMLDMTLAGRAGLFVGAWTVAQALARGPSSIFAGGLFRIAQTFGASVAGAYAAVFIAEAFGLLLALWLLREIRVARFQQEVRELDGVLSQVMD